jgi:hypothetical protein
MVVGVVSTLLPPQLLLLPMLLQRTTLSDAVVEEMVGEAVKEHDEDGVIIIVARGDAIGDEEYCGGCGCG